MSPHGIPRRVSSFLLALGIAIFVTSPGAQLIPDGPVIVLSEVAGRPMLDTDPSGDTVISWREDNEFLDWYSHIYVQRIGPDGSLVSGPFLVEEDVWAGSSWLNQWPVTQDVAYTYSGAFVVVWPGEGRLFDAAGDPQTDFTFGNPFTAWARVESRPQGDFVVGWEDDAGDYPWYAVQQQRFDADADPASPVVVSGYGMYYIDAELAMNDAGEFKVVWADEYYPELGVAAFDAADSRVGYALIDAAPSGTRHDLSVAEDGSFVVAWLDRAPSPGASPTFQRFNAEAIPLTPPVEFADPVLYHSDVAVTHDGSGGFIVIWSGFGEEDDPELDMFEGQQFDSSGSPIGSPFEIAPVNSTNLTAATDAGGNLTVAWEHFRDFHPHSVRMRRFCGPLRIVSPPDQAACAGDAAVLEGGATGRFPFSYQWRRNEIPLADGASVSGALTETLMLAPLSVGDSGSYDLSVTDSCLTPTSDFSVPTRLEVLSLPPGQSIGDLAVLTGGAGSQLTFRWSDVPDASDYEVRQDASPDGPFGTSTGTAPSTGHPELTVAMPQGTVFYLAVARNPCGEGPLRIPSP